MKKMKYIYPVRDRILVRRLEEQENDKTESGLFLPGTAARGLIRGEVVAVGEGAAHAEAMRPSVHRGDIVHYPEAVGVDVKFGGVVYRVLQFDQAFVYESAYDDDYGLAVEVEGAPDSEPTPDPVLDQDSHGHLD